MTVLPGNTNNKPNSYLYKFSLWKENTWLICVS